MAGARTALSPAAAGLAALRLTEAQRGETRRSQVARTLRDAIGRGDLTAGRRLPGHAALARQLGVARNTLVDALEQLEQEGYLRTSARSGTYVAVTLPAPAAGSADTLPALTRWARRALGGELPDAGGHYDTDFRIGQAVSELYPAQAWAQALASRAAQAQVRRATPRELALGPLETRTALAEYLRRERGAQVTPEMIMLTSGTQASLDALARTLLEEGRVAALEDPSYPLARRVLGASGAQLWPVATDVQGLDPAALPQAAALLYLTPGAQFPGTVALPAPRRAAVLAWAARCGALILEDDYAADLTYVGRPQPALQGLAPERVILLGSFSKSLAPVTRSGYIVAPAPLLEVLAATRPLTDRAPGTLDALALGDLLSSGAYSRHLRRVRPVLAARHAAICASLTRWLPGWTVTPARAGLHVHASLPPRLSEAQVLAAAQTAGIGLSTLGPLRLRPTPQPPGGVLLAFAHLPPEQIERGIARLSAGLADVRATP